MKTKIGLKSSQKTNFDLFVGPVKIKDGLFMGDQTAAKVQ